jgi:hypothetical protein
MTLSYILPLVDKVLEESDSTLERVDQDVIYAERSWWARNKSMVNLARGLEEGY